MRARVSEDRDKEWGGWASQARIGESLKGTFSI